ncbi:Ig-like domain-containing protein [uncultured Methanobrevibacter sp.]|uniref:Ig-like domain-containing protein n=1 Tax=uncultured Methanobrevibacter sp. TaxID=253161 RepID=UPI0025FC0FB6|nr:Ig-like domain-containing protein [uncultured Methanobrevibacter sp.]
MQVINCDFRFNNADDDGGAIYTSSDANTVVRNSYFWDNKAGYWGGAMCRGVAYDSSFYLNSADEDGGGMYYGEAFDCSFTWNTPNNVYGTDVYRLIKGKITLSQSGSYFGGKTVSAKVVDTNNNNAPLSDIPVTFKFSNGKSATVYTGSNGVHPIQPLRLQWATSESIRLLQQSSQRN